jgi:dynein heavy chain 1
MFAGITSSMYSEDGDQIQAMVSREGEEVKFLEPTVLSKDPIIYQWLTKLENNM